MKTIFFPLLGVSMPVLAATIFFCLIKAVIGPRLIDRIIMANMIGVKTIAIIAMLSVYLEEWYLLDICLVYALISFLAVVVLTMISQRPGSGNLAGRLRQQNIQKDSASEEVLPHG